MQWPTINGSSRGGQWLAMIRVRRQQLAMAEKGGGCQRRDCHGQRGVIVALEVAEASWIWTTKVHTTDRVVASRRMGPSFGGGGSGGSYCGDGIIVRCWKYK
jgi:hypothetical protein